jgi:aminoglycoside phosphotransferase (APT) family kinase protein
MPTKADSEAIATGDPAEGSPDPDSVVKHRKQLLGTVDMSSWRERLMRFMQQQSGVAGNVDITDIQLPSAGGSSGTLLFTATYARQDGNQEQRRCVLRYATEGGLFHTYNLPGQYSILQALQGSGIAVPGVVGIDADGDVLGVTGYVMERVEGEVPPPSYHRLGLMIESSPESRRRMVYSAIANLAKLHKVDARAPGFDFLWKRGKGATAVERDIDWHWTSLCWGCPNEMENLEPIRQWLITQQPAETKVCVNHGDSMLANYMFRDDKVVAVLDWELAFLGNPTNDVAYQAMTHQFLGLGCAPLDGMPTEQEWKTEYERISGNELHDWEYFTAVTAFKLHISLLLVYREVTPDMEVARNAVRDYTWQSLTDRIAAAKQRAA